MVTGYSAAVVSANGVNGKPRFARKTAVKTGGVGGWNNCPWTTPMSKQSRYAYNNDNIEMRRRMFVHRTDQKKQICYHNRFQRKQ